MATGYADGTSTLDKKEAGDQIKAILRRCRGRPRLTDSDRAQRRLESRKKYDVRRVYLGESHKVWSELRRRTSLSDAGLAEYLILLNSTYGEKYQQKYGGKKSIPELCSSQKKGKKVTVTSLRTLVSWYQDHCESCPHEPQLRAVEPALGRSTSVLWQCDSGHSFVQHLSWQAQEASESEAEDAMEKEPERGQETAGIDTRARRKLYDQRQLSEAVGELENATAKLSQDDQVIQDPIQHATALSQLPQAPPTNHAHSVPERSPDSAPVWEMGVMMEGGPAPTGSETAATDGDTAQEGDPAEGERDDLRGGGSAEEYECVVVTAALTDRLSVEEEEVRGGGENDDPLSQGVSQPSMVASTQDDLFETQTLQTMVGSCELPGQRGTLEGSQLIIITGPSYEALTSEGIQLNMGGADVEEVTCTVIEGVAYNQMCQSGGAVRPNLPDPEGIMGMSEKQLLQTDGDSHAQQELQRNLNRSKRSRRGPVMEADGMLKMFHCPYEGCSQVYVAISSFQNHVNLVHRKGRTKVCPHPGCGKKFYLSNHLHRHMIIHSGVRDFICETCGKSFKRKNHLEVHRRTHTGETPLQCEICGYQCRQRASLNWHMKKHTPEAHYNFTCEHCGKRFERLDSVKFHKLKSHPEQQST
ncbi:zinc finger protein 653 [Chanos chanos]|uniref:Zinc finger protein 653 n=1 Tax=Chanos chanos TaxID=29144 RepID=A0A6J2WP79_CHACN|nr:zinc finger protein 653-like [Chanos chanos]